MHLTHRASESARYRRWLEGVPDGAYGAAVDTIEWSHAAGKWSGQKLIKEVAGRQNLLTAPQKSRLITHWIGLHTTFSAKAAGEVLLSTRGQELQSVKVGIEAEAPGALYRFVWSARFRHHRSKLCDHLTQEVTATRPLRIATDIDNTLLPSRDHRYPSGRTTYPGVLTLFDALSGHTMRLHQDLIFLSARPGRGHFWNPLSHHVAKRTYSLLEHLGFSTRVLFGDVWHCVPRPWLAPLKRLGKHKADNFKHWMLVHPETRWLFFGDSGQADIAAALRLLADKPSNLEAVFIHDFCNVPTAVRRTCSEEGVILYRNAPHAAVQAFRRGLLRAADVAEVVCATREEFERITFDSESDRQNCLRPLEADAEAALQVASSGPPF